MMRRALPISMRWGTALTVNMPMLASNLEGIEAFVGNNKLGIANAIHATAATSTTTRKPHSLDQQPLPMPSSTSHHSSLYSSLYPLVDPRPTDCLPSSTMVLPMVKGNAYGCGILTISHFLSTELGYKTLGVASLLEAIHVLERLPEVAMDASQTFVVFSDINLQHPRWQRYYSQQRGSSSSNCESNPSDNFIGSGIVSELTKVPLSAKIVPVIGCKEDLHYFLDSLELCGNESPFFNTPLFIKVDTGMNRMGLSPQELVEASPRIRRLRPSTQTDARGNPLPSAHPSDTANASSTTANRSFVPARSGIDLLLTHFASSWFPVGKEAEDIAFLKWVNTPQYNAYPVMTTSQRSILLEQQAEFVAAYSTSSNTEEDKFSGKDAKYEKETSTKDHNNSSNNKTSPKKDEKRTADDLDVHGSIPVAAAEVDSDSPSATAAASANAHLPIHLPPFPLNRTLQQFHAFKVLEIYISTVCGIKVHNVSVSNSGGIEQKIGCGYYTNGNNNGNNNGNENGNHNNRGCANGAVSSASSYSPVHLPPKLKPANVIVRPGLMVYGPPSVTCPRKLWNGKTIGRLETKIVKTFVVGGIAKPARPAGKERIQAHVHSQKEKMMRTSLAQKFLALQTNEDTPAASLLNVYPAIGPSSDDAAFLDSLPPLPLPLPLAASSGSCVGYSFNATRGGPTVVAVLAIGYADGFLRYNTGLKIEINGLVGEVHGFVNMDLAEIVFYPNELGMTVEEVRDRLHHDEQIHGSDDPHHHTSSSPVVSLWSHNNDDIDTKATFLKTNSYQLLTALSVRVPRVYEYGDFKKPCLKTVEALKWDSSRFV